jgi:small-conductance mechanosensitive channel
MDVRQTIEAFEQWLGTFLVSEWTFYQFGIIAVGYVVASFLASRTEPALESKARRIKGNPDRLRVIVAFMRRLKWLFLAVWLGLANVALTQTTWPSRRWLVSSALTLTAAWHHLRSDQNYPQSHLVASRRVFSWSYVALYTIRLDDTVLTALDGLAVNLGAVRASLLLVLKVVVLAVALIWVAVLIGNVLSHWVQRSGDLSPSIKVLISKFIKIGLIMIAGAIALSATGIDLTALTVFSGAVGVGIGFGLQKVVSNFIAGIIILLDKSIKPGDTITLGDTFGSIRDLRSRFVSVITRDGKEYLIPNEDFISQQVVNWSFSSNYVRIDVDFGTAYDSDPHEVVRIAIATSATVDRVANTYKAPVCWLTCFGASSPDFRLRFWISDPAMA